MNVVHSGENTVSVYHRVDGLCFSNMSFPHRHTHTHTRGQSVLVVSVISGREVLYCMFYYTCFVLLICSYVYML